MGGMAVSESKKAFCPKCGKDLGAYRTDCSVHTSHKSCQHCSSRLVVMHGDGKLKVVRQK